MGNGEWRMIATISKGEQLTIPSQFRKALKLTAGSKVEVEQSGNEIVIRPVGDDLELFFRSAKRVRPKVNLTPEEMDELIENEILR
jgi:AbrB family looped-hinge helix DNA binding protein